MQNNFLFVIMGGTGDLAQKKLFPAMHGLIRMGKLGDNFAVVAVARKEFSREVFAETVKKNIKQMDTKAWAKLEERLHYYRLDFDSPIGFSGLGKYLETIREKHGVKGSTLFYLATLPTHFGSIAKSLHEYKLGNSKGNREKVVFEKPFGASKKSARQLNKSVKKAFNENQIFRIDHYLGKEIVQNISVLRAGNRIFHPLWNRDNIDHVQINLIENFGVENRGEFYDREGALRDVAQSHLLQLLCLTAMDVPKKFDAENIRSEKVKVLRSVKAPKKNDVVLGQYEGYQNEAGVKRGSEMETFFAMKLFVDNKIWKGVPLYLRSGKNLGKKFASIYIEFRKPEQTLFAESELKPNYLLIQIQPDDGMLLQLNGKMPGEKMKVYPEKMTFCHECAFGPNTPEAYETLIYDALNNDQSSFIRADEVELSWEIIDKIRARKPPVFLYNKGSFGPKQSDELMRKDKREWFNKVENVLQGI